MPNILNAPFRMPMGGLLNEVYGYGGLTFLKNFAELTPGEVSSVQLNADYSLGSAVATFLALRGASNPATYIDQNGIIRLVTNSNTGRITAGYYSTSGFVSQPGLMVEGAGTNLVTYSQDFNTGHGYALPGGTITPDAIVAPDGTTSGAILISPSGSKYFEKAVTLSNGSQYTFSVWLKGSGTITLRIQENGGDFTSYSSGNFTLTSDWCRYQITGTKNDANASRLVVDSINDTDTVHVWGVQCELLPFASSYIPTTTAALTRNAETLTYPISGNRTAATESIFIKFAPYWDSTATLGTARVLLDSDTKRRLLYVDATDRKIYFYPNSIDSPGTIISGTTLVDFPSSYVLAATCSSTGNPNAVQYVNGTQENLTNVDFTSPAWGTNFQVMGRFDGTLQGSGTIQSIAIFSDAKSAGGVAAISALMAAS